MEPLHIDLRRDLSKIRAAFVAGQLQITTKNQPLDNGSKHDIPTCQYSGPCAIGFLMSPEQRYAADTRKGFKSIRVLIEEGLVTCPEGQARDIINIQAAHDWGLADGVIGGFSQTLLNLECKYSPEGGTDATA